MQALKERANPAADTLAVWLRSFDAERFAPGFAKQGYRTLADILASPPAGAAERNDEEKKLARAAFTSNLGITTLKHRKMALNSIRHTIELVGRDLVIRVMADDGWTVDTFLAGEGSQTNRNQQCQWALEAQAAEGDMSSCG